MVLARVLLASLSLVAACGSGQRPVEVPPSADELPVGSCVQVRLLSHWGARTPLPASGIVARCAASAICKTHVSQQEAGLVYVKGTAAGASLVELDFRDPVTRDDEHKTTRVTFKAPAPAVSGDVPPSTGSYIPVDDSCGPDPF